MVLPIELFQIILGFSNFECQIRLAQLNKYLHDNLQIYDFLNIDTKYLQLLSNNILKKCKYIKQLNASDNPNITDEGIKHMKLHTLYAARNEYITDEGIS